MTNRQLNCEEVLKKLFDYIDCELDSNDAEELEMHLRECRHCFDRVEFERLLKNRIHSLKKEKSSQSFKERIEKIIDRF
jgi:anti-sigma factor (TIGR02949 family)